MPSAGLSSASFSTALPILGQPAPSGAWPALAADFPLPDGDEYFKIYQRQHADADALRKLSA